MTLNPRRRTRARIVRAGRYTCQVALDDWYGAQILAPVDTRLLEVALGLPAEHLPGVVFWVRARLEVNSVEYLELAGFEPYTGPERTKTAPPSEDDEAVPNSCPLAGVGTVPPTRAA